MRFDEILTRARANRGCSGDFPWVRVSGRSDAAAIVREALEKGLRESGAEARLLGAGSFGYGDLEPLMTVCSPGGPTVLYPHVDAARAFDLAIGYLRNGKTTPEAALCTMGEGRLDGIPRAVDLPFFRLQNRVALRNCGLVDPGDTDGYLACAGGYTGLSKVLQMDRGAALEALRGYGLPGGGECSFADATTVLAAAESDEKYVVCNGVGGDPRAAVSSLLLEGDPHAVLEGVLIVAYVMGAGRLVMCMNASSSESATRVATALDEMEGRNLVGTNILDSSFSCRIEVRQVQLSLVAEEETALLRLLEGKQAMPAVRPEGGRPTLFGKPALVLFPETLSRISALFQGSSADGAVGTRIVALSGDVVHSCVVEVPDSTTIRTLVEEIAGGVAPGRGIKAVGLGSPIGKLLGPDGLDLPIGPESAGHLPTGGSTTIEVFDTERCAVELARDHVAFLQTQTCGKCVFCREGILQMSDILNSVVAGEGTREDLELLGSLGGAMETGSICFVGKAAAAPVLGGLDLFRHEYEAHVKDKRCPVLREK